MQRIRPFIIFIVLLAIVGGLAVLSPSQQQGSPEHNSASDAPDGTSAFFALAAALGHRVDTLTNAALPGPATVLFVITPTVAFTDRQAADLAGWVRGGGTLVYASEFGDTALDNSLSLRRFPTVPPGVSFAVVPGLFAGAHHLAHSDTFEISAFNLSPSQVTAVDQPLGSPGAVSMGLEERLGAGRVVALGDPCVICNAQLSSNDDGAFAADVLALAQPGAAVAVDEFHHGVGAGGGGATDWISTPWGAVVAWLLVLGYAGFMLRSRAFGPLIPLRAAGGRSTAEYARAVGGLLRRTGGRRVTIDVVADATRRALAERIGLGHGAPPEVLERVLRQRAPELGTALDQAVATAAGASSERTMLEAARKLHSLAYPSPVNKRQGRR